MRPDATSTQPHDTTTPVTHRLSMRTILILAVASGLSVANIYYAQPLLDLMARDLALPLASAGLVVTLTQIGYALGLVLAVPLGDLIDPRRVAVGQSILSVVALVVVATAPSERVLLAGMFTVGFFAVIVQVLVAFAATLSAPNERGKAVGLVTSGIVIGILAARFVSGVIADLGGWRSVYLASAAMTFIMAITLFRVLPHHRPRHDRSNYWSVVRSIPAPFLNDRIVRLRGILALLIFAAFSTLWTSLVLPLSTGPYAMTHTQIGLFGLIGMAGATAAAGAGTLADKGLGGRTTSVALTILLASWGLIALLPQSIPALIAGIVLLDFAVQAVHVTNQSIIFAIYPNARSRLVGGYMCFYSVGSAVGAIASTAAFAYAGWRGVSLLGAGFSALALMVWAMSAWRESARPAVTCSGANPAAPASSN
ncbi:MFS transporter [Bradyrhizobium sp. SYSU BS000235]|uniref:MFS transporter n=1 Tax=Bradyrhizobium sp. SYSU BS000235 TaxID=3411332 RepID=UPI003C7904D0